MDDILAGFGMYLEAKKELDSCQDNCREDSGYFCAREYEAVEKAIAYLDKALSTYIDTRIKHALEEAAGD